MQETTEQSDRAKRGAPTGARLRGLDPLRIRSSLDRQTLAKSQRVGNIEKQAATKHPPRRNQP